MEDYQAYFGRVIVKYHKSRPQVFNAGTVMDKLEVVELLPSAYDGIDFPGYDRVSLSYTQLATIFLRSKRDWIGVLENQKAVYLITDMSSGKQYIGAAYGDNGMLLQRWESYIENGHGGNKLLKEVVDESGIGYVAQNFQFSILENYNARVDIRIIIERESWWKWVLGSRSFGLNAN